MIALEGLEFKKDGPTQSAVHSDGSSGAIMPFRLPKPKCVTCGKKHARGVPCYGVRRVAKAGDWDETKHPRGQPENKGEFGSGDTSQLEDHKSDQPYDTPKKAYGQCGGSVNKFHKAFPESKFVSFNSPQGSWKNESNGDQGHIASVYKGQVVDYTARQFDPKADFPVVEPLDTYKQHFFSMFQGKYGIDKGEWEPTFTPLPRSQMPQLGGPPTPNTPSASLPTNERGNVDLAQPFLDHLKKKGVKVTNGTAVPSTLKPSQSELNDSVVNNIVDKRQNGGYDEKPAWVSNDGYVIDGHHRWAAAVKDGDKPIPTRTIDLPVQDALNEAHQVAKEQGVEQEGIDQVGGPRPDVVADKGVNEAGKSGGFSLHPATGESPKSGFMVAIQGHSVQVPGVTDLSDPQQRSTVKAALLKFVTDNADIWKGNDQAYVGGWWDKAHGEFTLDPSENVQSIDDATSMGRDRNQQAVWDVTNQKEVVTGGTGDRENILKASGGWLAGRTRRMGRGVPRPVGGGPGGGPKHQANPRVPSWSGLTVATHQGTVDRRTTPRHGPQFGLIGKAAIWDASEHPRGQPNNAGEFGPGGGSTSQSATSEGQTSTPIHQSLPPDLISPHNADTRIMAPLKGTTESRTVTNTPNPNATHLAGLPEDYQQKILDQISANSPTGPLTPAKLQENLEKVWQSAQSDPVAMAAKTWYNVAGKAGADLPGMDDRTGRAFMASLSPRTAWFHNVVEAQHMSKWLSDDATLDLSPAAVKEWTKKAGDVKIQNGKKLSQMKDDEAAWALMAMMKHNKVVTPEITTAAGKPAICALSGSNSVTKAVQLFRGSDPSEALQGHKVRSFFNNMQDPDNLQGHDDVTVDTHMVSAAALARIGAKSDTIRKLFSNSSSTPGNATGAYALFADAIRGVAKAHNLEPCQMQAILWTHWQTTGNQSDPNRHTGMRERKEFPDAK